MIIAACCTDVPEAVADFICHMNLISLDNILVVRLVSLYKRLIYINEAQEMSTRYVKSNMNELIKRATESVGLTSAHCSHVEKFPGGMLNKTFLFTMHDGTQVVGKVPNPNAGRAHYTTASEVATMDFVSRILFDPDYPDSICFPPLGSE